MERLEFKARYYEFAGFCLDVSNRELLRSGEHVHLTQKCFETLLYLVQNRGRMLQKEEILNSVWQENYVEEANLAQHIYLIRKAFRTAGESRKLIETIPKFGYRFVGEVTEHTGHPSSTGKFSRPSAAYLIHETPIEHTGPGSTRESDRASIGHLRFSPFSAGFAVAAAVVLMILAITYLAYSFAFGDSRERHISSIVIIPFENIDNAADMRVVQGVTTVLAKRLNEQPDVHVSAAPGVGFASRAFEDPVNIGRKHRADAVLSGTFHHTNGVFKVTANLINVASRATMWSGTFDAGDADLYSLPETISNQIAAGLDLELPASTLGDKIFEHPEMLDAFSSYAVGVHYCENSSWDSLEKAMDYLTRAVKADPGFAEAIGHLADVYALAGYNHVPGFVPSNSIEKAKELANRALILDPDSSQAYSALALVALYEGKHNKAKTLFERSVQLQPGNARARMRLAWLLSSQDNLDGAIDEMRQALRAKPQSTDINISLARLLRLNRQTEEALKYGKHALKLDPTQNETHVVLAEIYEQKGELDQSVKELESVPKDTPEGKAANLVLGRVFAKKGNTGEAIRILRDAESAKPDLASSYDLATIYASLGNKRQAVKELQASRDDSLIHYLHLKYDYNIDSIRKSPDYTKILTKSSKKLGSREGGSS